MHRSRLPFPRHKPGPKWRRSKVMGPRLPSRPYVMERATGSRDLLPTYPIYRACPARWINQGTTLTCGVSKSELCLSYSMISISSECLPPNHYRHSSIRRFDPLAPQVAIFLTSGIFSDARANDTRGSKLCDIISRSGRWTSSSHSQLSATSLRLC